MAASIRQLFQLLGIYAKMDLLWFLRDTKYCVLNILSDIVSTLAAVSGVFLLAEQFGNIGGMDQSQILFMLGYASLVDGVISMCFSMNNVAWISRIIGRGQLDHRLIQPVPLWMQLLTEGFIPVSGNSGIVCGVGITAYSISQLGLSPGPLWLLALAGSVLMSVAVILSFSYITSSLAFYAPVAGEEISTTAIRFFGSLKTIPLGGLALPAKVALSTVLPIGLTAWLPASILLGQNTQGLVRGLPVLVTIILVLTASTLFKKGMKYYAKSGSIRYLDRGHRR